MNSDSMATAEVVVEGRHVRRGQVWEIANGVEALVLELLDEPPQISAHVTGAGLIRVGAGDLVRLKRGTYAEAVSDVSIVRPPPIGIFEWLPYSGWTQRADGAGVPGTVALVRESDALELVAMAEHMRNVVLDAAASVQRLAMELAGTAGQDQPPPTVQWPIVPERCMT